jgi:hypothetical protein
MTGYRETLAVANREVVHGREPEQKVIRDLLRRARQGAGGLVLLDGEPGSAAGQVHQSLVGVRAEGVCDHGHNRILIQRSQGDAGGAILLLQLVEQKFRGALGCV